MIEIRPGTEADRPQILARTQEVFGAEPARRAERLWDWQWHEDPRLPSPGYRGVVAEWDGRIIGVLSTIPAGLHIGGQPVQAWWFVDVLVHWGLTRQALREQRRTAGGGSTDLSGGIAAALFDHPAAGPIQLGKHIADAMMAIGHRLGFAYLTDTGSLQRRVSTRHPLGRLLGTALGDLTGAVADLALPPIPRPTLPVRLHEGPFDRRFDSLWESLRPRYPAICRRDSALLEWRYHRHPDQDYRVLIAELAQGLRGYCITKVFERGGRRRGKIVDLLAGPEDSAAQRALLAGALGDLRRQRAERAECFYTGGGQREVLAGLGFKARLSKSQRPQPLMARGLPDSVPGLYVTQGDGDGG
jgi:hypothetical protein